MIPSSVAASTAAVASGSGTSCSASQRASGRRTSTISSPIARRSSASRVAARYVSPNSREVGSSGPYPPSPPTISSRPSSACELVEQGGQLVGEATHHPERGLCQQGLQRGEVIVDEPGPDPRRGWPATAGARPPASRAPRRARPPRAAAAAAPLCPVPRRLADGAISSSAPRSARCTLTALAVPGQTASGDCPIMSLARHPARASTCGSRSRRAAYGVCAHAVACTGATRRAGAGRPGQSSDPGMRPSSLSVRQRKVWTRGFDERGLLVIGAARVPALGVLVVAHGEAEFAQPGGHLPGVARVDAVVAGGGGQQQRRAAAVGVEVVVRRPAEQVGRLVGVSGSPYSAIQEAPASSLWKRSMSSSGTWRRSRRTAPGSG